MNISDIECIFDKIGIATYK